MPFGSEEAMRVALCANVMKTRTEAKDMCDKYQSHYNLHFDNRSLIPT